MAQNNPQTKEPVPFVEQFADAKIAIRTETIHIAETISDLALPQFPREWAPNKTAAKFWTNFRAFVQAMAEVVGNDSIEARLLDVLSNDICPPVRDVRDLDGIEVVANRLLSNGQLHIPMPLSGQQLSIILRHLPVVDNSWCTPEQLDRTRRDVYLIMYDARYHLRTTKVLRNAE